MAKYLIEVKKTVEVELTTESTGTAVLKEIVELDKKGLIFDDEDCITTNYYIREQLE